MPTTGVVVRPWHNETEANMFLEADWTKVPAALKAVALGECGATLTLQTKVGSAYAADPFIYQNSITRARP